MQTNISILISSDNFARKSIQPKKPDASDRQTMAHKKLLSLKKKPRLEENVEFGQNAEYMEKYCFSR